MNACDIIPMGRNCIYECKVLILPCWGECEPVRDQYKTGKLPYDLYCGDSTVNDQPAWYPYQPEAAFAGWGQMLPAYLSGKIAVSQPCTSVSDC